MSYKKVSFLFDEIDVGVDIELFDDTFFLCVTEYEKSESESTSDNSVYKPSSKTEVYLSEKEINSIINGLMYLKREFNRSDDL